MKTYANRRMEWVLATMLGLMMALIPAVGFSQDANEAPPAQETAATQPAQAVKAAEETQPAQNAWDNYEVILNRNMFSRQRGSRQPQRIDGRLKRQPIAVPNPESYYRLCGVAQEDGTFVAFLEDTRTGSVTEVREGSAVARGTIKSLTLDAIEYQRDDQVTTVQIGYDLEGGQGAVTMNEWMEWSDSTSTGATTTSSPSTEAPTGDAAEMLRQMMERRRQELSQ